MVDMSLSDHSVSLWVAGEDWAPQEFNIIDITKSTISYNMNGGSGTIANQTKTYGQNLTLSTTKPTRTGYTFVGWNTSSSAATAQYQPGGTYTANEGATLYAIWKANTYTVSYNMNGGSGTIANQTKTYGQNLTLSTTKPTRTGYTFVGWNTSSSAATAQYQPGGTYTANEDATLYAIWKANTYNVSYNMNGGSGSIDNQTKTYNVNLTLSTTKPTRTGYTFVGWNTSSTATTAQYQPGGTYSANANATLYAVWKANTVDVTSVSLNATTVTLVKGKTVTLTATVSPSNATNKTITWSSSNPTIAKVSSTGVVTAVAPGVTNITISSANGKTAGCRVTVNDSLANTSTCSSSITLGNTINITGNATGGTAPYTYEYYFKQASQSDWSTKLEDITQTATTVKPGTKTTYNIMVIVKDSTGKTAVKTYDVTVK